MNYNEMHFYKLKYGEGTRGTVYADKNARVAYKEFDRATPPLESTGKILKSSSPDNGCKIDASGKAAHTFCCKTSIL